MLFRIPNGKRSRGDGVEIAAVCDVSKRRAILNCHRFLRVLVGGGWICTFPKVRFYEAATIGQTSTIRYFLFLPYGDNIEPKKKEKKKKRKLLKAYEVAEIVISKGIRNRKEPLAFADMQGEGKIDLAELVANRGAKFVNEVFETAWEMETTKTRQEWKPWNTEGRMPTWSEIVVVKTVSWWWW